MSGARPDPLGGPAPPASQQKIEAGALAALGVACGIYVLHWVPSLLFPNGLVASVVTLLLGTLLGLGAAAGALALAFYRLTHAIPGQHAHAQLRPPRTFRRRTPAPHGSGNTATAPGPTLPHAIAVGGELSGLVYTLPASQWRPEDTVGNWPPTSDLGQGAFKAWHASLAQGTLVLRPIVPPPGAKPPSPGRGPVPSLGPGQPGGSEAPGEAGAGTAPPPAAPPPPPAKVGIPLDGCSVELVAEGLRGRSEFIRRAPLRVSHPRWKLLEGEAAFYLWADDPASKQQWLHALGWWCADGERLRAIEAMYEAYCRSQRDRSVLGYPEQAPAAAPLAAPADAGSESPPPAPAAEPRPGKRGWKGWGSGKGLSMRRRGERRGEGGAAPAAAEPGSTAPGSAAPSPSKPGPSAAELQSLESFIDAKWMQSRRAQPAQAVKEAVVRSKHGSRQGSRPGSVPTSPKVAARPAAGAQLAVSLPASPAGSFNATSGVAAPAPDTTPAAGALAGPPRGVRRSETSPAPLGAAVAAALPPGSPLGPRERLSSGGDAAAQQADCGGPAAAPAQPAGAGAGAFGLPPGLPPLLSADYAVNAFVTRLAFDLLRRPDFQESVRARVQRQLSRLQRPDYIQTLEVVDVDCGATAPTLRGWRALPQPAAAVWPQVVFDMSYQGAFTVTIEMKVDIRDAAAWGRLDQALTRLAEGRRRRGGAEGGASPAGGSPRHAASAPALAGGAADEGGEEEEGEPLSPASGAGSEGGGEDGAGAGAGGGRRGFMGGFRKQAARKLRQLAETTAAHISRIPLRISLTFSVLEGTMCAWVPPPPGNRLFYAFVAPPHLELAARPELAGRLLKYSYHIARVSSWVEGRMRAALCKNMVFPGGGDIPLAPLLALSHANAADGLPALGRYAAQAEAEQPRPPAKQQQQQQQQQQADQQAELQPPQPSRPSVVAEKVTRPAVAAERLVPSAVSAERLASPAAAAPAGAEDSQQAVPPARQPEPPAPAAHPSSADPPPAPAAAAGAAPASAAEGAATHSGRRSAGGGSYDELEVEPSLSLPDTQPLAAAGTRAPSAAPASGSPGGDGGHLGDAHPAGAAQEEGGHLISPRHGAGVREAAALDLRPRVPAGGAGRQRSASDAFDEALSREGAADTPTPRFASQQWQQAAPRDLQRQPVSVGPLGAGPPAPPAAEPQLAAAAQRPALQLKLSATRSLDPDFVTSAEHTGFGEAPPSALPDYRSQARSQSARSDGSAASAPGGSRESVGASLGRSLVRLRHQGSQQSQGGGSAGASGAGTPREEAAQPQPPSQHASPEGAAAAAATQQQGGPADGGDARRLRPQGSFKDQAGKFFRQASKQMKETSKALASQVKEMQQQRAEMQQQRAEQRAAGVAGLPRSGSSSARSSIASPAASPRQ